MLRSHYVSKRCRLTRAVQKHTESCSSPCHNWRHAVANAQRLSSVALRDKCTRLRIDGMTDRPLVLPPLAGSVAASLPMPAAALATRINVSTQANSHLALRCSGFSAPADTGETLLTAHVSPPCVCVQHSYHLRRHVQSPECRGAFASAADASLSVGGEDCAYLDLLEEGRLISGSTASRSGRFAGALQVRRCELGVRECTAAPRRRRASRRLRGRRSAASCSAGAASAATTTRPAAAARTTAGRLRHWRSSRAPRGGQGERRRRGGGRGGVCGGAGAAPLRARVRSLEEALVVRRTATM